MSDLEVEQKKIRTQSLLAFLLCSGVMVSSVMFLPSLIAFPSEPGARFALAIQTSVFHFVTVLIAVRLVSSQRFRSAEDIAGSASGPPSAALSVKAAFLQNTLEQAFLGLGAHLLLASVASGRWLAPLFASASLFVLGRWSFYCGYTRGAGARAFGMATTALASLGCYLIALVLLTGQLVGG